MDETFGKKDLPKRYVGFSSCFRREAGSYGKDTKGILRVHQFDKVEMFSYTLPENGDEEHEYLLELQEKLFQALKIPYRVTKMVTGDLGAPVARKYDLEAWIPSQEKYREVTSTSTTTDFQSRRLNIRFKEGDKLNYVHMLNGTAFAIGRTLIAILENNQKKDGTVVIPEVLRKWVGKDELKPANG
jgi:seryl-tRNA synthetase